MLLDPLTRPWRSSLPVVPYTYPGLSTRSTTTSPFTLVFRAAGSHTATGIVNAVVLSSVLSAGNHALFAGTRVMHSLAQPSPV
jgi:amino acid transporter, AAT family